jgi:HSP20 family protein
MSLMTRFQTWDPFDELTTLRDRMDRLFARVGEDVEQPILTGNWMPVTDVFETREALILKVELPGMTEKDIDIEFENNVLTITGERKFEEKTEEKGYQRFERKYGKFVRAFTLPPNVAPDKILANYANGILEINIPKKEESKPKKVKLEVRKALQTAA